MSGKLDQSLDEILSTQRKAAGRRSSRRSAGRPAAPAAPAGGVKKNVKPARNAGKPTPAKGSGLVGESKIVVSNMVSTTRTLCNHRLLGANILLAQGCLRGPDQGMLPMRPSASREFCRRLPHLVNPSRTLYRVDSHDWRL